VTDAVNIFGKSSVSVCPKRMNWILKLILGI